MEVFHWRTVFIKSNFMYFLANLIPKYFSSQMCKRGKEKLKEQAWCRYKYSMVTWEIEIELVQHSFAISHHLDKYQSSPQSIKFQLRELPFFFYYWNYLPEKHLWKSHPYHQMIPVNAKTLVNIRQFPSITA